MAPAVNRKKRMFVMWEESRYVTSISSASVISMDSPKSVCRGAPGHLLGKITVLHHIPDPVDVRIDGGVFLFFNHMPGIPEVLTG